MINCKFIYNADISSGSEDSHNILIQGDNRQVLPELVKEYGGKVKCVYIDPPYNNGDAYQFYNDKVSEASWLSNLRGVLVWLRALLTKDGSIWISIDDTEMAYLKVEADKIFGRENFACTIVWQHRKTRENRALFSYNHEYILVYAKDIKAFKKSRNLLPVGYDFVDNRYKNPDNDPRGAWQSITASVQAGHAVPSQFYTIISPAGVEYNPPKGRCWVYNEERMKREISEGNIWFGSDGTKTPRIKKFLSAAKIGLTPQTLWAGDEYGTTDSAKKHLLSLFHDQEKVFDTPKPEELIRQILEIATNKGDIVLDCYLGSGTTLAVAHKLKRNYIGIEIGVQMTDLVVHRLNSVIRGEQGGISKSIEWQGGGQFAFFNFNKEVNNLLHYNEVKYEAKRQHFKQLNLWDLFDEYGDKCILENPIMEESDPPEYHSMPGDKSILPNHNVLISLVKKDNEKSFLEKSAKIYYTGKKFPSTVVLDKLYYFMPYIKGRGVRDLWYIKLVRLGFRKEGTKDEDQGDIRLVFELQYVGQFLDEYTPIELKIWRSFTDTTIGEIKR